MNRALILPFCAAFLPILVFVVVEELYGVVPGLVVAILVTAVQFVITRLRGGGWDGFLLFDLALIGSLGGVSLLSGSDLFFKMKPAVLQALLAALLLAALFAPAATLERFATRAAPGMRLNRHQLAHLRRLCGELAALTLLHAALIVWAALHASQRTWAFVSAGLFYLLVALYFLKNWLDRRRHYRTGPHIDLVDPAERTVGTLPEGLLPLSGGALHRAIHLHLLNRDGALYLAFAGGGRDIPLVEHVRAGETPEQALARRLGPPAADDPTPRMIFKYHAASADDNEIIYGFLAVARDAPPPGWNLPAGEFHPLDRVRADAGALALSEGLLAEIVPIERIRAEALAEAGAGGAERAGIREASARTPRADRPNRGGRSAPRPPREARTPHRR